MSDWQKVKIGDLFNIEKGSLQSSKCTAGNFDFITASRDWKTHNEYTHEEEALIIAVAASGSLGRVHYVSGKFISSDLCFILTPKDPDRYPLDLEFYFHVFRSIRSNLVQKTATGTSKLAINKGNFSNYKLPYFDINHQKKFCKKLINLEKNTISLNKNSNFQKSTLKNLRQQILQDAISGKLTADWRAKNPDIEPASELLKKIKAEKEKLIAEKKIRKEKPLPSISEDEIPFALSEGWEWVRLGEILEILLGGCSYKSYAFKKEGENQVLRLGNIRPDYLRLEEKGVFIDNELAESTTGFELKTNDILITMTGTRGKQDYCYTVMISDDDLVDRRLFLNQRVGCFRFMPQIIGGFLNVALKNDLLLNQIYKTATGSANQANIGATALKNWIIPLPPRAEQKAIVAKVEKLMQHLDQLEEKITQNTKDAEMLMQAFLGEVFRK